jgi:simple sugar transport system permease protein
LAAAQQRGIPTVLDPVGAGATPYRNQTLNELLAVAHPSVIRGNGSEIMSTATAAIQTRGVDSSASANDALGAAQALTARTQGTVCVSGETDHILDAHQRWARLSNGHVWMTKITGVGCSSTALIGALVSLFLGWLGIRYKVDQIIAGTVINIGAVGITSFAYLRILQPYSEFNRPIGIDTIQIPLLSEIPLLGPILFSLSPYFYGSVGLVLFFTYMIYRTRWGLRLRAAGEQPNAAGTVGIDVVKLRYRAMIIAGLLAGFAGSYISLSGTGGFGINTSAGKGFIALAAVIFGAWNPIFAFGASLVFGMASAATTLLSGLGVGLPPQILLSIPYIVTLVVVAGLIGRVRAPASAGRPYDQG